MAKPGKAVEGQIKRLTDYVHPTLGAQLEGKRLDRGGMDEVLGQDVKLLDFIMLQSKEERGGEYALIQFEYKGEICVGSIGAKQVVQALKQMPKNYLPVLVKIVEHKSPTTGRFYKTIE